MDKKNEIIRNDINNVDKTIEDFNKEKEETQDLNNIDKENIGIEDDNEIKLKDGSIIYLDTSKITGYNIAEIEKRWRATQKNRDGVKELDTTYLAMVAGLLLNKKTSDILGMNIEDFTKVITKVRNFLFGI